jgi:hypothetical protein
MSRIDCSGPLRLRIRVWWRRSLRYGRYLNDRLAPSGVGSCITLGSHFERYWLRGPPIRRNRPLKQVGRSGNPSSLAILPCKGRALFLRLDAFRHGGQIKFPPEADLGATNAADYGFRRLLLTSRLAKAFVVNTPIDLRSIERPHIQSRSRPIKNLHDRLRTVFT